MDTLVRPLALDILETFPVNKRGVKVKSFGCSSVCCSTRTITCFQGIHKKFEVNMQNRLLGAITIIALFFLFMVLVSLTLLFLYSLVFAGDKTSRAMVLNVPIKRSQSILGPFGWRENNDGG